MEDRQRDGREIGLAREVGAASYRALRNAAELVKPGAKLVDVADAAERFLKDSGYGAAFPINLSIGSQAAHYAPSLDDEAIFSDKDVVKVDFGAEKGGVLGDCALTIDLSGGSQDLVEAADEALLNAISKTKAGAKVCEIGGEIDRSIRARGFVPIRNLGGHSVEVHELHSSVFVPNYDNGDETQLEEGMVVAIEPFATTGKGLVTESDICDIYGLSADATVRSQEARLVLQEIKSRYPHEPFAVRWLSNVIGSRFGLYAAIAELARAGILERYPTLVEVGKGIVAQAEAEVLVGKDGCEVLTK